MYTIDHKQHPGVTTRLAAICMLLAVSVFSTTPNAAEAGTTAYVDSVYSWGAWELGIEPAAGPRAAQNTPMNDRSASLQFRPNDNAAFQTVALPEPQAPIPPIPSPPVPVVGPGGSGPIIPGATPTAPNRRR